MPAFLPNQHGFPFPNAWPDGMPVLTVPTPFGSVPLGNARNGVCGGMVYAVIDLFSYGLPVPSEPTPDVFRYLVWRLFDSWDLPFGALRYYTWQIRSRVSPLTIRDEWPKVKAVLDAGQLAPLGLSTMHSWDPRVIGHNHQVLAYGYEQSDNAVSLKIYDPNYPNDNALTLTLDLSDPERERPVIHGVEGPTVRGFFLTEYRKPLKIPAIPSDAHRASGGS